MPAVIVGTDVLGHPMGIDLGLGHLLVAGATGCGKTSLVQTLILQLARSGYSVAVLNPKVVGYSELSPVCAVFTAAADYAKVMTACVDEMRRRYELMGSLGEEAFAPSRERPRFVLVVEEVAAITGASPSKRDRDSFLLGLTQYSNLARGAGMSLALVCQSPDAATLGNTVVRSNCATKVAMRNGHEQMRMMVGDDEEALARSATVTLPGELLMSSPLTRGWVQGRAWRLREGRGRELAEEIAASGAAPRLPGFLDFSPGIGEEHLP